MIRSSALTGLGHFRAPEKGVRQRGAEMQSEIAATKQRSTLDTFYSTAIRCRELAASQVFLGIS